MTNTELYIQNLLETNPLREPLLCEIIESLGLPAGSHGLDAGCGIGLQTMPLLDAVGLNGHIIGLDILPELLDYAQSLVEEAGLSKHISFRQGDVNHLPFDDNSFDWVWSMDCVGYPAEDLGPVLQELIRVTKPGGEIIILGWTSQQVLPGYPLLEARLNATCSAYLPFLKDKRPETNFMNALPAFQRAGLKDTVAHTFVGTIQSPLHEECRVAITSLFNMLWGTPQPEVSPEDWQDYQKLCKPTSPDFILNLPEYYGFFTYSAFFGKVNKA